MRDIQSISNEQERRKKKLGRVFLWLVLIIFSAFQFFPMIWVTDFSLAKDTQLFGSEILVWPDEPQWSNYVMAWTNGHVLQYALNSLFVVVCTIVITVFFSLTLGYAFTRMRWKHAGTVLSLVLLGMMIPIHTTLLPNFLIYKRLHMLDTPWALILPYSAFSIPLGVFIMTGFMRSLPAALEEAAIIDGCGVLRIVFQIAFPLTKSASATIAVMTFINNWNEFIMASTFLSSPTWKTLPFSVYEFAGQYTSRYAVQFAVMVLASVPALLVYALLNEQITKGVMYGAVKE